MASVAKDGADPPLPEGKQASRQVFVHAEFLVSPESAERAHKEAGSNPHGILTVPSMEEGRRRPPFEIDNVLVGPKKANARERWKR